VRKSESASQSHMSCGEDRPMKMSMSDPMIVMASAFKSSAFTHRDLGEAAAMSDGAEPRPLHEFMVEGGVNSLKLHPDEGQKFTAKTENSKILSRGVTGEVKIQNPADGRPSRVLHHQLLQHNHPNISSLAPVSAGGTLSSDGHHQGYFENPFSNTNTSSDNFFSHSRRNFDDVARLDQQSRQDIDTTTVDYPTQILYSLALSSTPKTTNTSGIETINSIREDQLGLTTPGTEMGYGNIGFTTTWGRQQNSIMIEESEAKDHNDNIVSITNANPLSPSITPMHLETTHVEPLLAGGRQLPAAVGTPSTVSTAASTDDASFEHLTDAIHFDKLSLRLEEPNSGRLQPRSSNHSGAITSPEGQRNRTSHHHRCNSWDDVNAMGGAVRLGATPQNGIPNRSNRSPRMTGVQYGPPSGRNSAQADSWSGLPPPSLRNDQAVDASVSHAFPPHTEQWRQQQRGPQYFLGQHQQAPLGQQAPHHMHLPPSGAFHGRKCGPLPTTPPRGRNGRQLQPSHRQPNSASAGGGTPNPPRSSSEILKTLLRKKACLYEPETSRAVALVTWLVGRELALAYGYFSRQQLQSGVHACVAKKIDAGSITRTKVNRCMQIILNSCFHYIIPRPDGSEENGEAFRSWFAHNTKNDSELCKTLHAPWNDVVVDRELVLSMTSNEAEGRNNEKRHNIASPSPQSSPRLSSVEAPPNFHDDGSGDHGNKRAVLLCFNENVRSAEDVFRCHNEFIRDTANAAKLQLTAQEWRAFFGRDASDASAWGSAVPKNDQFQDYLGHMKDTDLFNFRSTWCAKRYDHDHELCGFAHFEVNGGWLRRNPQLHRYQEEMCPSLIAITDKRNGTPLFTLNECPRGLSCGFCHNKEELLYHPNNYKAHVCKASVSHNQQCRLGDICPNLHPKDSHHPTKKSPVETRHVAQPRHGHRQGHHNNFMGGPQGRGMTSIPPPGAPMLYVHPAPFSCFDRHLAMPGLQNLFRRQSAVIRASLVSSTDKLFYSNFGDDVGIREESTVSSLT